MRAAYLHFRFMDGSLKLSWLCGSAIFLVYIHMWATGVVLIYKLHGYIEWQTHARLYEKTRW